MKRSLEQILEILANARMTLVKIHKVPEHSAGPGRRWEAWVTDDTPMQVINGCAYGETPSEAVIWAARHALPTEPSPI
jgi:hypothetical protein